MTNQPKYGILYKGGVNKQNLKHMNTFAHGHTSIHSSFTVEDRRHYRALMVRELIGIAVGAVALTVASGLYAVVPLAGIVVGSVGAVLVAGSAAYRLGHYIEKHDLTHVE